MTLVHDSIGSELITEAGLMAFNAHLNKYILCYRIILVNFIPRLALCVHHLPNSVL